MGEISREIRFLTRWLPERFGFRLQAAARGDLRRLHSKQNSFAMK